MQTIEKEELRILDEQFEEECGKSFLEYHETKYKLNLEKNPNDKMCENLLHLEDVFNSDFVNKFWSNNDKLASIEQYDARDMMTERFVRKAMSDAISLIKSIFESTVSWNFRIAFTGKAGSGKSTASNYLEKIADFQRVSFAKPLYDLMYIVQERMGLENKKDRKLLQFLGEHARKTAIESGLQDPILTLMDQQINKLDSDDCSSCNIVVDDLRMKVEKNFLEKRNFFMFRIVGRSHSESNMSGGSTTHKTEVDLDDEIFETINNNFATVDEFERCIHRIYYQCLALTVAPYFDKDMINKLNFVFRLPHWPYNFDQANII